MIHSFLHVFGLCNYKFENLIVLSRAKSRHIHYDHAYEIYTTSMVAASPYGGSRPLCGGVTRLEDNVRDLFSRHGWQHNLRIGPPPT
jgi:hypothetical protein